MVSLQVSKPLVVKPRRPPCRRNNILTTAGPPNLTNGKNTTLEYLITVLKAKSKGVIPLTF